MQGKSKWAQYLIAPVVVVGLVLLGYWSADRIATRMGLAPAAPATAPPQADGNEPAGSGAPQPASGSQSGTAAQPPATSGAGAGTPSTAGQAPVTPVAQTPAVPAGQAPAGDGTSGTGGGTSGTSGSSGTQAGAGTGSQDAATGGSTVSPDLLQARQRIDRSNGAAETMKVTVYYVDGTSNAGVLQPVEILVPKTISMAGTVLEQLLNPPVALKLYSGIPPGTRPVHGGVNLRDGVLTVDLSKDLYEGTGGSAWAAEVSYALVWSMTEIRGVTGVLLRVDGRPAQLEGLVWDKPITREQLAQESYFRLAPPIEYRP